MGKGSYDEIGGFTDQRDLAQLTVGFIAAQVIGIMTIILAGAWMSSYRGGFGWATETVFNYHPLFMSIGLIYLYGNAMLIYRMLRTTTKLYVKIAHAVIQVGALLFATIGLKAAFDSHNKPAKPIPNMYSLHSWIGLAAVILFGLQWVMGFVSFLFPKLSDGLRRLYLPHHKFWGIVVFGLCCATALMGITEKAIFSLNGPDKPGYANLPGEAVLLNMFGVSITVFGVLVIYLVTKFEYSRPPEHVE